MRKYLFFVLFLSGCLLTHKDIEEGLDYSDQERADEQKKELTDIKPTEQGKHRENLTVHGGMSVMEKISQVEASIRELRGQMEKISKTQKDRSAELEQGILSLIQTLDLRVAALAEKVKSKKQKDLMAKDDPERLFKEAERFFKKENWKQAIINYEKYREKNKTGKFYKKATFQIGLCFQKLTMHKEAKVFFREVLESFPKSAEAKEARELLSTQKP